MSLTLATKQPINYELPPISLKHHAGYPALVSIDLPSTEEYSGTFNHFIEMAFDAPDTRWEFSVDIITTHGSDTVRINKKISSYDLKKIAIARLLELKEVYGENPDWLSTEALEIVESLESAIRHFGYKGFDQSVDDDYEGLLDDYSGFMLTDCSSYNSGFNGTMLQYRKWMFFLYLSPDETKQLTFDNKYDSECSMTINMPWSAPITDIKFTIDQSKVLPLAPDNNNNVNLGVVMRDVMTELYNIGDPNPVTNYLNDNYYEVVSLHEKDGREEPELEIMICEFYMQLSTLLKSKVKPHYVNEYSTKLGEVTEDELMNTAIYMRYHGAEH